MSFEFQSTLVNVTPNYRIGGSQIGGVRMEKVGDIDTIRLIITNDADIRFAESGPFESGNPAAIYAALAADLYEIAPGILVNEGAIGSIEIKPDEIVIDLEGSDRKFKLSPDAEISEATEIADHNWKLTTASFDALTAAAGTWRSSMDGTLEGLSASIATEIADRIAAISGVQADVDQNESDSDAAIAAEAARVDALIASGMWLFDDQASFPPAADNHGRVVHSHADGAIFYSHGGMWHQVAKEADLQSTIDSVASEASTREAADTALSGRLDVLEADPTTATAVAAGDTATLSSANSYTDTSITNLVNGADVALDTLKEIGDALAQGDSDVTAALTAQITTESTTRANADSALSGRLDVLEADPTTQSALDAEVTARNSADSALDGRVTTLEGNIAITDPTTATALAAVQSDVDANESDADAAIAGLDGRLVVLEADPTNATAVAAVQADVDQNEADADAALALKAPLADPDFTGQLEVDTNARLEFDSNLTKISNVLRGTDIEIGNNITLNPAAADGRVEIEGGLYLRPSDIGDYSNDADAAAGGVVVGGIYHNNGDLKIRLA